MNSFTDTILTLMLGWLRTLLNVARDFVSSDSSTVLFTFFRNNWRILFLVLCIGGFALDKIIYLIRWRPQPVWAKHRKRRAAYTASEDAYDLPAFDDEMPALQTSEYAPAPAPVYTNTAPTMQYQMKPSQYDRQTYPSPAVPQYEPEISQSAYTTNETPLPWSDTLPNQQYPAAQEREQRFAFGMAPSFGSAQSEPAYTYHRDATPAFAPMQYAGEDDYATVYAPPEQYEHPVELYQNAPSPAYREPSPQFRPFSDRGSETFAPPKTRRLGTVAKKARNLLSSDDAYGSLTYQDLHPTVDVSKAFHSPVYPEKKPKEDV